MLPSLARRRRDPLLVQRNRELRLLQPGPGRDQLEVRLVVAGIEGDRSFVRLDGSPQLVAGVALEQIAVVVEQASVGRLCQRTFVQRLGGQKIGLVTERLVTRKQLLRSCREIVHGS